MQSSSAAVSSVQRLSRVINKHTHTFTISCVYISAILTAHVCMCVLLTACYYCQQHVCMYQPTSHPHTLTVEGEVKVLLNDGVSLFRVQHKADLGGTIVVHPQSANGDF